MSASDWLMPVRYCCRLAQQCGMDLGDPKRNAWRGRSAPARRGWRALVEALLSWLGRRPRTAHGNSRSNPSSRPAEIKPNGGLAAEAANDDVRETPVHGAPERSADHWPLDPEPADQAVPEPDRDAVPFECILPTSPDQEVVRGAGTPDTTLVPDIDSSDQHWQARHREPHVDPIRESALKVRNEEPSPVSEPVAIPGEEAGSEAAALDEECTYSEPPAKLAEAQPPAETDTDASVAGFVAEAAAPDAPVAPVLAPSRADAHSQPAPEPSAPAPRRQPGQYRPQLRDRPRRVRQQNSSSERRAADEQTALQAELLLKIRPGGAGVSLFVLLRRPSGSDNETRVRLGASVELAAANELDELFAPIALTDTEQALEHGVMAEAVAPPSRIWSRSGRQLHVFSQRGYVAGFRTVPRVLIGQENIVLCAAELAPDVLQCCTGIGSEVPSLVEGPGIPDGWVCLRGIRPRIPGSWQSSDEILEAMRPHPDADIELTGGLPLDGSRWLTGMPPEIRIAGADAVPGDVTIDGFTATLADTDRWIAPEWDSIGQHQVRYAGLSRTYEIADLEEDWPFWSAHPGPGFAISGARALSTGARMPVAVEGPACWLLGPKPGQIVWAPAIAGQIAACGIPEFAPIWSIPPKIGRRRPVAQLIGNARWPQPDERSASRDAVQQWAKVIRMARNIAGTPQDAALWNAYADEARRLWRRVR